MLTDEQLTALEALLDKMTPGTWTSFNGKGDYTRSIWIADTVVEPYDEVSRRYGPRRDYVANTTSHSRPYADAAGIAALRNAAPALLAAGRRALALEAENERLREALRKRTLLTPGEQQEILDYIRARNRGEAIDIGKLPQWLAELERLREALEAAWSYFKYRGVGVPSLSPAEYAAIRDKMDTALRPEAAQP
jgi:hypothetical protein